MNIRLHKPVRFRNYNFPSGVYPIAGDIYLIKENWLKEGIWKSWGEDGIWSEESTHPYDLKEPWHLAIREEHLPNGEEHLPASDRQVGGDHYKKYPIQPLEYAVANKMGPCEHAVVKYVTRHQDKGKEEDIRKAIHYCQLILEFTYGAKSGDTCDER